MAGRAAALRRQLEPAPDAPHDRIDQIWTAGAVTVAGSQVVGSAAGPGSTSRCTLGLRSPGVVSTLDVTPGVPPVMVAPDPLLAEVGDTLHVAYHAPGSSGERVRIVPAGGDPVTDALDSRGTPPGAPIDGSVQFPTGALARVPTTWC